jgi:tRNA(Arg) A34 adenosine deaminase TadA
MVVLSAEARREERTRGPYEMPGPFSRAQHSIGRLAYRVHACRLLFRHAESVHSLLDQFEVRVVPRAEAVSPPLHDGHTSLRGILNRMLRKDDPMRQKVEENLIDLDSGTGIFRQFMESLSKCSPQVHAEIQTLEHFSKGQLNFACNDRFIAISKPACLCCKLYFQYHPARMVIPQSHEKVWSNWSPPRLEQFAKGDGDSNIQRDVLNKIIEALRNDVVAQILKCSQPAAWHADSVAGLTALDDDASESTDYWTSESDPGRSSPSPSPSPNSSIASSPTQGETKTTSPCSQGETTTKIDLRKSVENINDDDDDGGVAI